MPIFYLNRGKVGL